MKIRLVNKNHVKTFCTSSLAVIITTAKRVVLCHRMMPYYVDTTITTAVPTCPDSILFRSIS